MKAILGRPDKKRQTPCIASQLYMSLAIESKPGQSQHVDLLRTGNALATPSYRKSYHKPSRLVKANPSASFSPLRRKEPVAKLLFCINTGCTESLPCARGGGPKGRRGCVQEANACYDPSVSLEADSSPYAGEPWCGQQLCMLLICDRPFSSAYASSRQVSHCRRFPQ